MCKRLYSERGKIEILKKLLAWRYKCRGV